MTSQTVPFDEFGRGPHQSVKSSSGTRTYNTGVRYLSAQVTKSWEFDIQPVTHFRAYSHQTKAEAKAKKIKQQDEHKIHFCFRFRFRAV